MSNGWKNPSVELRVRYMEILRSRKRALTAAEVAILVGVTPPTALQMLYALERDGVVDRKPGGGKNIAWALTGQPLPAVLSASSACLREPRTEPVKFSDQDAAWRLERALSGLRIVRLSDEERA